jgi:deoxyribonuclease V
VKAALDVYYEIHRAMAACVVFDNWQDQIPMQLFRTLVPTVRQYHPGRFYERELPCLLAVLQQVDQAFETIIIDGFVHLRAEVGKGLGLHLSESLPYVSTVIGVAKNPLRVAERFVPIIRGHSKKPLFVSAIGCSLDNAAQSIASMHGSNRIPTLLKYADQLARSS